MPADDAALSLALAGRLKHGDLWRAMRERGWNQRQLAEFLGEPQQVVGRWLNLQEVPGPVYMERIEGKLLELTGKLPDDLWPEWSRDREFLDADKRVSLHRDVTPRMLADRGMLALPPTPEEVFTQVEQREAIKRALHTLTPRQERVLVQLYGLDGQGERTLAEVGESFGVQGARIRQIEAQALRRLRHPKRRAILGRPKREQTAGRFESRAPVVVDVEESTPQSILYPKKHGPVTERACGCRVYQGGAVAQLNPDCRRHGPGRPRDYQIAPSAGQAGPGEAIDVPAAAPGGPGSAPVLEPTSGRATKRGQ